MLSGSTARRDAGASHRRGRLPDRARHEEGRRRGAGAVAVPSAMTFRTPGVAGGDRRGVELTGPRRRAGRDRGVPGRRGRPGRCAADALHGVHRQRLPPVRRRDLGVRLQPHPRRPPSRCSTPATTTPTSGSTSTTCCCRPASTSTWRGASSAEPVSTTFPEPVSTPDLRGLMLDYLDFLRGVITDKVEGLADAGAARVRRAVWLDTGGAGHPPRQRRAALAALGLPGRARPGPLARRGRRRRLGHTRTRRRPSCVGCSRRQAFRSRSIVEAHEMTETAAVGGHFTDAASAPQLQWILLHLIQEYARHAAMSTSSAGADRRTDRRGRLRLVEPLAEAEHPHGPLRHVPLAEGVGVDHDRIGPLQHRLDPANAGRLRGVVRRRRPSRS